MKNKENKDNKEYTEDCTIVPSDDKCSNVLLEKDICESGKEAIEVVFVEFV
jgi:hypothetical protein